MFRVFLVAVIATMTATPAAAQHITATGDTLTPRCCVTSLELVRDDNKSDARKAHKAYMKKHRQAERWIRKTIYSTLK